MRTRRERATEIGGINRIRKTSTLLTRLVAYLPPRGHDHIADALRDKATRESSRFLRERTELMLRKPGQYIVEGPKLMSQREYMIMMRSHRDPGMGR